MDGIPMADIRAQDAWDFTTGDPSIIIAVIDSGVDCNHPELAGKCVAEYNAINDTYDAQPPDPSTDITRRATGPQGVAGVGGLGKAPPQLGPGANGGSGGVVLGSLVTWVPNSGLGRWRV